MPVKLPNVLMLFTDDQRFDTIHALGNDEIKTPNLDELVRNGTSFTQAHIQGGTVGAVCMPSRAMLHTGRTLFHLKKDGSIIPEEHNMLGEIFRDRGYNTFATGKWHNGPDSYSRSFTAGGEIFFGGMNDHWNVPACHFDPSGRYEKINKVVHDPYHNNKVTEYRSDHITAGKHSTELFSDISCEWLKNYSCEDPFFMYISFMAPHDPRTMPDRFLNMYDPEKIELPDNYEQRHAFDFGIENIRDEMLEDYPRRPEKIKQHIAQYYAMISHIDHEIGKVIETLKRTGHFENTIIVFAGDNGLALGRHGLMGKQNCYEHSIRVPLIFSGPGIPKNNSYDGYVYLFDIFPTLCDLIGAEIPESVEGSSFCGVFKDNSVKVRDMVYSVYGQMVRSIKDERYKLIEYRFKQLKETQLFDLAADPGERHNLYGDYKYTRIINDLSEKMRLCCKCWDDEKHPAGKVFWSGF